MRWHMCKTVLLIEIHVIKVWRQTVDNKEWLKTFMQPVTCSKQYFKKIWQQLYREGQRKQFSVDCSNLKRMERRREYQWHCDDRILFRVRLFLRKSTQQLLWSWEWSSAQKDEFFHSKLIAKMYWHCQMVHGLKT